MAVTLPMPGRARVLAGTASAPVSAAPSAAAKQRDFSLLFAGYVVLVLIEYGGLYVELPLVRTLHVSTILRCALIVLMIGKVKLSDSLGPSAMKLLIGIWALTAFGVVYAEIQMRAYVLVRPMLLDVAFAVVTVYLIDRRSRIDTLAMLLTPIVAFLVFKNLGRMQASRAGGLSAPFFMGDRNDFAWAMLVLLPIVAVLLFGQRRLITRAIGLAGCAACLMGVVFSQSRGGGIGLVAALLYGWWFVSKRRMLGMVTVIVALLGVYMVAPAGYFERMETVTSYEEDNSAQGRIEAWTRSIEMALDHPLGVGAGNFPSSYGRHYRNFQTTRINYGAGRWINAHSIYFRILGEYGFPGLIMFIWMIVACLRDNLVSARLFGQHPNPPIDPHWPSLLNMSIIGFAAAGTFLSGFDFPHIFLLVGLTVATRRMASKMTLESPAPTATAASSSNWWTAPVRAAVARKPLHPHARPVRPLTG